MISHSENIIFFFYRMELDKKCFQIINMTDPLYEKGVIDFIEFAFNGFEEGKLFRCMCRKCNNILFRSMTSSSDKTPARISEINAI